VSHNSKIAWKKISPDEIKHLYTEPLQLELEALGNDKECKNGNDTDDMLRNTVQIIHKHSARLKKSKYSKGLKPYWNETLKTQFKAKNDLWKKWQEDGSPKSGITYNEYRQAKRVFRQELRNAKLAYEKSEMQNICQSGTIDPTHFWLLVNKPKIKHKTINPIQTDKTTITEPKEIRETWKTYFENLYTPSDNYDNDFQKFIEEAFDEQLCNSYETRPFLMDKPITCYKMH
jgi:hypothetical protein